MRAPASLPARLSADCVSPDLRGSAIRYLRHRIVVQADQQGSKAEAHTLRVASMLASHF
jgi:hypothetical protein